MDSSKKVVLPILTTHRISSSSSMSGNQSARGQEFSPMRFNNTTSEIYDQRKPKELESVLRASMELRSFSPIPMQRGGQDPEALQRALGSQIIPRPPERRPEAGGRYERRSGRELKVVGNIKGLSKSKTPPRGHNPRRAKSPIDSGRNSAQPHQGSTPSNPHSEFTSPKPPESVPNAREQLASLVLESIKANSIPIALESKQVNKKVLLVPTAEPEDISGNLVFTKQGFFEIPKEKGKPSRFISKKEFAMETMNFDILSKLPFVQNYHKHKQLKVWRATARAMWYRSRMKLLSQDLWLAKPILTAKMPEFLDCLNEIRDVKALDIHENYMYGKRHTDFYSRQTIMLTTASSLFEQQSNKIMQAISAVSQTLAEFQKREEDDFVYRKMTDKLEKRKGDDIGLSSNKRSAHEEKQKYERKTQQDFVFDRFLQWILTAYQHATITTIRNNAKFLEKITLSNRRPRFEVFLQATPQLAFDPSISFLRDMHHNSVIRLQNTLCNHSCITQLHWLVVSSFHLSEHKSLELRTYKEFIAQEGMNQEVVASLGRVQKSIDVDLAAVEKWSLQYTHLKNLRIKADQWVLETDQSGDIIAFYREHFSEVNSYQETVSALPIANVNVGMFTLDTAFVRSELLELPTRVYRRLHDRLQSVVTTESADLRGEVYIHYTMLDERAASLPQYSQQLQSLSTLKSEKVHRLQERLDFLQECLKLCKKENIRIPAPVQLDCDDARIMLAQLPEKIAKAEAACQESKPFFEQQIVRNADKLSRKIRKFEEKYKEHYLMDSSKVSSPEGVLRDLEKRETALATIKQRVEVFASFETVLSAEAGGESLSCVGDFKRVFDLHCDTLKCWKLAVYVAKNREIWHESPFTDLNFKKIKHKLKKVTDKIAPNQFITTDMAESKVVKSLQQLISELSELTETLTLLKDDALKPRHWEKVFQMLRKPQLFDTGFTLKDLKEAKIVRFIGKITTILEEAKVEAKQETALVDIKSTWESATIDTESYRNRLDIFLLTNADKLQYTIEEHMALLEALEQTHNAEHMQGDIVEWKEKLQVMGRTMDVWRRCQEAWLLLEPIFTSEQLGSAQPKDYSMFRDVQMTLKKIMWAAHQSPKAVTHLLVPGRLETLSSVLSACEILRKTVKDFLESRRIAYPRFFFFSDSQLLEFFSKVHAGLKYDHCISAIFPGIQSLYIRRSSEELYDCDPELAPFNKFSPAADELLDPFDFSSDESKDESSRHSDSDLEAPPDRSALRLEKQKRLREQLQQPSGDWTNSSPSDIVGVIGPNEDVLMLETPVAVHAGVESWMSELEVEIGTTLRKLVSAAIASFPKQSLDEWILDYPIQTILTTITLIITHEITELFHSFQSASEPGSADPSYSEIVDEPVTEKYESHFSRVFFSSNQESESVMDQSRQALVKLLQAKSYKGLYLRLQFWVNQIANNMRADREGPKRLQPLHRLNLMNFVTSLLYQRDLVYNLHKRKVRSEEDFEWRKLLRVYLGANDTCCRVECGGWGMVQEQEYLGSTLRLLCTPESTRYYLYLSSVLRESGSVLLQPQPGSDTPKEAISEFANAMGVCCQFLPLSATSSPSLVMNFLNGAALAHIWLCLEGVTSLPLAALHAVVRETQMVKQQFLIAGISEPSSQPLPGESQIEDSSVLPNQSRPEDSHKDPLASLSQIQVEGTVVQKSITQSISPSQSSAPEEDSGTSQRKLVPVIRSNSNMFVVFASLAMVAVQGNEEFLRSAKVTFRVKELVRPPIAFVIGGLLLMKGFKSAKSLGGKVQDVLMKLISMNIQASMRDLYRIAGLARIYFASFEEQTAETENEAVSAALLTWSTSKSSPNLIDFTQKSSKSDFKAYLTDLESAIRSQFPRRKLTLTGKSLQTAIQEATTRLQFGFQDWQEHLVEQLLQQLIVHRGVIVVGNKGCGKTACTRILLEVLKSAGKVVFTPVNPEVVGREGLFGHYEGEGSQAGLLEGALHGEEQGEVHLLQMQSDQAGSWWLEPLLSLCQSSILTHSEIASFELPDVLTACKSLCRGSELSLKLPTGVHLSIPPSLCLVCEVADLSQACAATVTSLGRLYIANNDLNWDVLLTPTACELAERYASRCLNSAICLKVFADRIKPLVEAADARFSALHVWNVRRQMSAFASLLLSLVSASAVSSLPELGEAEGLNIGNSAEIRLFLQEHESHPKVREAKEVLCLAMCLGFVWSFGGPLSLKDRAALSQMMTEGRSLIMAKYMFPRAESVFDFWYDWKSREFKRFDRADVARLSANSTYDPATKTLCVPTLSFLQLRYATQMALYGTYDGMLTATEQRSAWVELQGPEGAGKSACAQYLVREFQQYLNSNCCSVSPLLTIGKLTTAVFPLFAWKTRTNASTLNTRKVLLVIDDLHLDDPSSRITQALEFLQGCQGCYDPNDHQFKSIKELSLLSLAHPRPVEHCLCLALESPDAASMKEIMTVYIFSRKFTTDSLVHRWSTTLIQVLLSARKEPEVRVQIGPHRVFTALTRLIQATLHLETTEPEIADEERKIQDLALYEVLRSYRDRLHDPARLDSHLEKVLLKRINYRRPLDWFNLCVDYFDPMLPYRSLAGTSPDIESKSATICEKAACSCFSKPSKGQLPRELAQIVGLTLIPQVVTKIWALCRSFTMEDGHFLWVGRRSAAQEVVQIACSIRKVRLIDPTSVPSQDHFYRLIQEEVAKLATAKRPEHLAILIDVNQLQSENWLLTLQSMLMDDVSDWGLFNEESQADKANSWILRSPFHLARKFMHVVILADSELQVPLKPRVIQQCDMLRDEEEPLDWPEIALKYLNLRGELDTSLRPKCVSAVCKAFEVVAKAYEVRKDTYIGMEQVLAKSFIVSEFLGPKRFIQLIDLTTSLYTRLKAALQAKIAHMQRMESAASDFEKLHTHMESFRSNLQYKDMTIAQNLMAITAQIDTLRKSQQDQKTYIDIKEKDNERLRAEVEVVEGEIDIVSRNKIRAIEDSFGNLKRRFSPLNLTTLVENRRILVPPVTDLLVILVAIGTRNSSKMALNEALAEIERPAFIEALEGNQRLPLSDDLFVDLAKALAIPMTETPNHPILEAVPAWLEAVYQLDNLKRALGQKMNKLSELNKQVEINMVAIDFSNKHISDTESRLDEQRQLLLQYQQQDASQKRSLEDAEITSIRTDSLITYVSAEKTKYQGKLERAATRLQVCFGDAVVLACSAALLGVLPPKERVEIRGQLANALAGQRIAAAEVWTQVESDPHLKEFRRVLKVVGLQVHFDLSLSESLFSYLHAISLPVVWDQCGVAVEWIKAVAIDRGVLTLSCCELQAAKRLEKALESNVTVFLEDFRPNLNPLFCRMAAFSLDSGQPCRCNKLIRMFSDHFSTFQVAISSVKTPILPRDYWARGTFLRCSSPSQDDLKIALKIAILALVAPSKAAKMTRAKKTLEMGSVELKRQVEALSFAILSVDEKQLQDSDYYSGLLGNLRVIVRLRGDISTAKADFDQLMQEDAVLLKQAGLALDLYTALVQVAETFAGVPYSWGAFLTITEAILAKCMRDVTMKLQEDSDSQPDPSLFFTTEDFFKHSVLPALWKVVAASLPLRCTPLLALAFALRVELSTGRLSTGLYELFWRLMRKAERWEVWMTGFESGEISEDSWEKVLMEAEKELAVIATAKPLKKIRKELAKLAFQLKFVPVILPEVLEKSKHKAVPLFFRILISLYYPDSLTRRLLRQFIFEQLNSIFVYSEDSTPMQHFIKSASWSFPILLVSEVGLNVVSLLCAMANYYGVGLEVARTDPEEGPGRESDPCQVIEKCALEGAWVLVATPKFPSFLKKAIQTLDTLRSEGKILNTFRLLIDLQGLTEIPDSFLHSKCVRFHLSSDNVDEIEEAGDVWQTVLQGQVLTASQLDMSQ